MKIGAAFPSKFLKADDLQGRTFQVQISAVRMEDVGTDQKPEHKLVMYFLYQGRQADRPMIVNRTNADTIAMDLGDETDNWIGHTIELFSMRVQGPNGPTNGIRCRVLHPTQTNTVGTTPTLIGGQQQPQHVRTAAAQVPATDPFAGAPTPTPGSYGARDDLDPPF